jgi:hypothetical protein
VDAEFVACCFDLEVLSKEMELREGINLRKCQQPRPSLVESVGCYRLLLAIGSQVAQLRREVSMLETLFQIGRPHQ